MLGTPWRIVHKHKSEYLVIWKVERVIHGRNQVGYFKFIKSRGCKRIGPLLANELICYRLARLVNLPVAKTRLITIRGHRGILSMQRPSCRIKTWKQVVKRTTNIRAEFIRPNLLYKTFVFDAWICNIDRSGSNVIVYPKGGKYGFYLIDHELALLGAIRYENRPWRSMFWDNIETYTRGYRPALIGVSRDYAKLAPHVQAIQNIRPARIRAALNGIPTNVLSKADKLTMERMLIHRQQRLPQIISSCCRIK